MRLPGRVRPGERMSVLRCLTSKKCFNALEAIDSDCLNVARTFRAAVTVYRINLYPETVVPIGAPRFRQPGADGHKEQDQEQQRYADRLEHGAI